MTPWTKIEDTEIWNAVKEYYKDSRRKYHDFNHIIDLYNYADQIGFEYDKSLDYAILFHDVIYDHIHAKESRSILTASMILAHREDAKTLGEVAYLIGTTENHSFNNLDNRLVMLDLYGFCDDEKTFINHTKIIEELKLLYPDMHKDDLKQANFEFLLDLDKRLSEEIQNFDKDCDLFWHATKITNGLNRHVRKLYERIYL